MTAGSWVRSFHCKSTAAGDVAAALTALPPKKPHHLLLPRSSCASSGDAHNKNVSSSSSSLTKTTKIQASSKARPATNKPKKPKAAKAAASVPPSPSPPPGPLGPVPALTELPAGHSSRQVVEIIFLSSWSSPQALPAGVGSTAEVEMLFRVHNPARAVARFEDYRAAVRARAGGASRSAADGNEMMRFSPAPPPDGYSSAAGGGGGEDATLRIRTFDGSGGAHANGRGGPASGRRAMFLCRVIAGRVADGTPSSGGGDDDAGGEPVPSKEYDSVRAGKGELVVFDRRAVLPCFLIIYKL
uniref:PARP catalytic domain-containing protein n=1 Tax=Leersia perrieri TaxID=77586 RepID=A0A0D9VJ57_9ORYZ